MAFPRPEDYPTYDPKTEGYGSARDWSRKAKKLAQLALEDTTVSENLRILGLSATPTAAELKRAFHRAAFQAHPDQGGDHETFIKVQRAYEELLREL
jgi:DnaJ-class molecular chaperone